VTFLPVCGIFVDRTFFLYILKMIKPLRGWEFDEMEGKSSSQEKPINLTIS
jgi:hypothetical protein